MQSVALVVSALCGRKKIKEGYLAEPMSIAATVYSYFGVQNPEVLTADAVLNPSGDPKIDESLDGILPLF